MTIIDPYDWVAGLAATDPARPAIHTPDGETLSYADLDTRAAALSATLAEFGVTPGDRILVQAEKSVAFILLYLASLRMGAIFVPLNTGYADAEVDYFISDADPALIVTSPARANAMTALAAGRAPIVTMGTAGDGSLLAYAPTTPPPSRPAPDASRLAAFLYTSGTTGRPKGAMLTCGNFTSNAHTLAGAWHFTSGDVLLHALPLFHAHGLFVGVNTTLAAGSSLILLPKFDPAQVFHHLPGASVFMGVPTFYTRLLQDPALTRDATAHMRLFVSGSAPLLAETHQAFEARTGHAILERYGMTETLMNASNPHDGARVPGTVGPPLPGIEIIVTDPATGAALPRGEIGMLEVRGPNVFTGYWRNPAKTADDLRANGFFITGDLARIDDQGYVHIVGRGKDLIISGGYNIYPREIEAELDSLDGVEESAVIGVPDPDFGEAVVAVLIAKPGHHLDPQALAEALKPRLARFKHPKHYQILPELPRNAMGKVMKAELRKTWKPA
ncbi:AMP-binding protein [Polymorphobacter sp.]|uniref:AMP-binding protein n=1 Tax=Polymorphobacter sp. TaxID=1909290 RepID=UPI003F6E9E8B